MRQIAVPDEVFERAERWAAEQHVPVADFVAAAIVDQIAVHRRMAARAARSNEADFQWALAQAPNAAPAPEDR